MSSDSLSIDIRLIRIGDAHVVRREGLMCGSISEVESDIRAFIASKHERVLLVRSSEKPIALVKLFVRDRHNYSASFEYILVNEIVNDTDLLTRIMDEVLHYCFIDVGLHKVSTLLTPKNIFWEPLLVSANFSQEAILKDEVKENDRFVDAGLFSLLSPNYLGRNVCFVPFQRGILAVYGSQEFVTKTTFYHYGDKVEDEYTRAIADYKELLDESGCFFPRGSEVYGIDHQSEIDNLPKELGVAYTQLREYFSKHIERFDVKVDISKSTEFQRLVWNEIKSIPYGATRSYEDIALSIMNGDRNIAKKLTRAVGSACSENPIPVIIPCHRVIGKDGKLVGFSGGVDFKDFLLQLEAFPMTIL
ncbi:MAG: methylated-DNA--[protein]-cysteine S-methyltransferase [Saccharofermentanaceae bacterium]|jgi:O-6-methylguanine DNA methyltransferase|nr:methylated-DNA--[protein]-cysteine S-methyltransferase [Clostridia bacterium]NLX68765.1 methylated-DNA--[protein]-cysteine S-methyltransferase [Clostridiaceae bacterium]HOO48303.1 methylated-DNA--[protein]-cysteine S-methyltransferase [Saccharofermentans sp.]HPE28190.1 methylated-DNA--[protein]-cysteine S-methyltransferase [Saccharofermentans sp.]HPG64438.1 methylated-DNA--[protein]-cysteine S-methyltransferase [Saccharofermentans sp.]